MSSSSDAKQAEDEAKPNKRGGSSPFNVFNRKKRNGTTKNDNNEEHSENSGKSSNKPLDFLKDGSSALGKGLNKSAEALEKVALSVEKAVETGAVAVVKGVQKTPGVFKGASHAMDGCMSKVVDGVAPNRKPQSKEEKPSEDVSALKSGSYSQDDDAISLGTSAHGGAGKPVVIGPVLDFLTSDAMLFLLLAIAIALHPTCRHWELILENQTPRSVVGSWMLVAFALGQLFSSDELKSTHTILMQSLVSDTSLSLREALIRQESSKTLRSEIFQREKRRSHSVLVTAMGSRVMFQPIERDSKKKDTTWSTLTGGVKFPWEKTMDLTKIAGGADSPLMDRFLKNERLRKICGYASNGAAAAAENEEEEEELQLAPTAQLRGVDVFLTEDGPDSEISTHPWLLRQGLRDVPTVLVNIAAQWGHILIYLQLPDWVTRLDGCEEKEDDAEPTLAIKRFLNGDDEYRNERLHIMPSVVEGPFAVRILAPPQREIVITTQSIESLKINWKKYETEEWKGKKLHPLIEAEIDGLDNPSIRSMMGILKRNIGHVSLDIGVVLKNANDKDEPQALIALWRLDHIDLNSCSVLPDRHEEEAARCGLDPDSVRSSTMLGLSSEEMQKLAQEMDDEQ